MFKVDKNKISLTRGDTAYLDLDIADANGIPYVSHAGDQVILSVKRNITDENYAFQKSVNPGEAITIKPEDTQTLDCGRYVYDIQLTTSLGEVFTIIEKNVFCIGEEVTNGK